jgi:hypothetical protein
MQVAVGAGIEVAVDEDVLVSFYLAPRTCMLFGTVLEIPYEIRAGEGCHLQLGPGVRGDLEIAEICVVMQGGPDRRLGEDHREFVAAAMKRCPGDIGLVSFG